METENKIIFGIGTIITCIVVFLSILIKDLSLIWIQTRFFGLLAYFFLFLAVLIGELRVLTKIKANFALFRYHTPTAIFAIFLVFLHFVSAFADNYKWGKTLSFAQYFGFSFSDKWLFLLSIGTLAFYLMLLIGITSATKSIQFLGFRNWKLIHYLSYICFIFVLVHSFGLGTDIKTSFLAPFLQPAFLISGSIIIGLLLTRIVHALLNFNDQLEINLVAIFFILLVLGSVFFFYEFNSIQEQKTEEYFSQTATLEKLNALETHLKNQSDSIENLKKEILGANG